MYVLYVEDQTALATQSQLFDLHMEPLLQKCDAALQAGTVPASIPEIPQYLQVCRWPFRRLEYAFALDALISYLGPGQSFLDAGSGATPLAHAIAAQGVAASACDGDARLIDELRRLRPETIYGTKVSYSAQDLTRTSYPDDSFDAIACISVLEHIPAPADQQALHELLRILKPGGLLVLTVDFTPPTERASGTRTNYLLRRSLAFTRAGDLGGLVQGVRRKLTARLAVLGGQARRPRSANQCFEVEHLKWDLTVGSRGTEMTSRLAFPMDLEAVTTAHARRFWELTPGLFANQGHRYVLPAAQIVRKTVTI